MDQECMSSGDKIGKIHLDKHCIPSIVYTFDTNFFSHAFGFPSLALEALDQNLGGGPQEGVHYSPQNDKGPFTAAS